MLFRCGKKNREPALTGSLCLLLSRFFDRLFHRFADDFGLGDAELLAGFPELINKFISVGSTYRLHILFDPLVLILHLVKVSGCFLWHYRYSFWIEAIKANTAATDADERHTDAAVGSRNVVRIRAPEAMLSNANKTILLLFLLTIGFPTG